MAADYTSYVGRLENWKFQQALTALPKEAPLTVRETTAALAASFGDTGWFDGHVGQLVEAVVALLLERCIIEEQPRGGTDPVAEE